MSTTTTVSPWPTPEALDRVETDTCGFICSLEEIRQAVSRLVNLKMAPALLEGATAPAEELGHLSAFSARLTMDLEQATGHLEAIRKVRDEVALEVRS